MTDPKPHDPPPADSAQAAEGGSAPDSAQAAEGGSAPDSAQAAEGGSAPEPESRLEHKQGLLDRFRGTGVGVEDPNIVADAGPHDAAPGADPKTAPES